MVSPSRLVLAVVACALMVSAVVAGPHGFGGFGGFGGLGGFGGGFGGGLGFGKGGGGTLAVLTPGGGGGKHGGFGGPFGPGGFGGPGFGGPGHKHGRGGGVGLLPLNIVAVQPVVPNLGAISLPLAQTKKGVAGQAAPAMQFVQQPVAHSKQQPVMLQQPVQQTKPVTYQQPIVTYAQPIVQALDTTAPTLADQSYTASAIVQPTFQTAPLQQVQAISATAPTINKGYGAGLGLGSVGGLHGF